MSARRQRVQPHATAPAEDISPLTTLGSRWYCVYAGRMTQLTDHGLNVPLWPQTDLARCPHLWSLWRAKRAIDPDRSLNQGAVVTVKMLDDPFLNYFALGLLIFVVVVMFYGIIAIHDIPAKIAEARHHPHHDAIHAAGWVSLFTLHVMWPFLWIWAMAYRPERGWGFSDKDAVSPVSTNELEDLRRRVSELEKNRKTGD